MISLDDELIPLSRVPEILPPNSKGRKAHKSTVWRWALYGLRGRKLEILKLGGGVYTTRDALRRFAQCPSSPGAGISPEHREQREREKQAAKARLAAAGV